MRDYEKSLKQAKYLLSDLSNNSPQGDYENKIKKFIRLCVRSLYEANNIDIDISQEIWPVEWSLVWSQAQEIQERLPIDHLREQFDEQLNLIEREINSFLGNDRSEISENFLTVLKNFYQVVSRISIASRIK